MTPPGAPGVSICLLTYNHAHMLRAVLDSVLAQAHADFELIVSDDCSTDGTWELLQEFAARDARVIALRNSGNVGMATNANIAVAASRGAYVLLLHHDDICSPDMLDCFVPVMENAPGVGFVFNEYLIDGKPIHAAQGRRFSKVMAGTAFLREELLGAWGCPVRGTAFIRRSCFDEVGGMDPQFGILADVDLWMRLSARWDVGYVSSPVLAVHVDRPEGYPRDYVEFTWRRVALLYAIHAKNTQRLRASSPVYAFAAWMRFRVRVTLETAKWLVYAYLRNKVDMLRQAEDGKSPYELPGTNLLRRLVMRKRPAPPA